MGNRIRHRRNFLVVLLASLTVVYTIPNPTRKGINLHSVQATDGVSEPSTRDAEEEKPKRRGDPGTIPDPREARQANDILSSLLSPFVVAPPPEMTTQKAPMAMQSSLSQTFQMPPPNNNNNNNNNMAASGNTPYGYGYYRQQDSNTDPSPNSRGDKTGYMYGDAHYGDGYNYGNVAYGQPYGSYGYMHGHSYAPAKGDNESLKDFFFKIIALVPVGLLLAAIIPSLVVIPAKRSIRDDDVTNDTRSDLGRRLAEAGPLVKFLESYEPEAVDDPECFKQLICNFVIQGREEGANVFQKGLWRFLLNIDESWLATLKLKTFRNTVINDRCKEHKCEKTS